jgi:TonB family protein
MNRATRTLATLLLLALLLPACVAPAQAADEASIQTATKARTIPPKCSADGVPEYPRILRQTGNKGSVTASMQVGTDGAISAVQILASTHPAFERSAITYISRWKCLPATRNGVPVASRLRQAFEFHLEGGPVPLNDPHGTDTFAISNRPPDGLPDLFKYDTPPRVSYVAPLVYPLALLKEGVSGKATVRYVIGPNGRTSKVTVLEATRPEFGASLKASIESWVYEPAKKAGQASWALVAFQQEFNAFDRDAWTDRSTDHLLDRVQSEPDAFVTLKGLDSAPRPIFQPSPRYPPDLEQSTAVGSATIEFYIGDDGQARLPRVVRADDPQFGWAAATAVARWRFAPPLKNGQPVETRVQVPIQFQLPQAAPAPATPPASASPPESGRSAP